MLSKVSITLVSMLLSKHKYNYNQISVSSPKALKLQELTSNCLGITLTHKYNKEAQGGHNYTLNGDTAIMYMYIHTAYIHVCAMECQR